MTKFYCLACNGLDEALFGNPLTTLVDFVNEGTPDGIHFNVVGGVDPRPPVQAEILADVESASKAGYKIIFMGHSLGAGMAFYVADYLHGLGITAPLFISLDPTQWGTNAPGVTQWALSSASSGKWYVPDNIARWRHFRQPGYPGGGYAFLAPLNGTTDLQTYERTEDHVDLPRTPAVEQLVLQAILDAIAA